MSSISIHRLIFPTTEFRNGVTALESSGDLVFNQGLTIADLFTELQDPYKRPALASRFTVPNATNLNAEFLYGIISTTDMIDGSGTELLGNSAFADTDGDGFL